MIQPLAPIIRMLTSCMLGPSFQNTPSCDILSFKGNEDLGYCHCFVNLLLHPPPTPNFNRFLGHLSKANTKPATIWPMDPEQGQEDLNTGQVAWDLRESRCLFKKVGIVPKGVATHLSLGLWTMFSPLESPEKTSRRLRTRC